jgi:integrase/recombinase XerD
MAYPSSIVVITELYQTEAEAHKEHLLKLGYDKHTVLIKFRCINEFFSFLESKGITVLESITAENINDYYNYIQTRPSKKFTKNGDNKSGAVLSEKSVHTHMRSIQLFFAMALQQGKIIINPASALKFNCPPQSEERTALTQEEIKLLYECCTNNQERIILSLAYGCGLRVSELVLMNIEDIKLREQIIIVPKGKFNKRRVVPLSKGVTADIENYFYQERIKEHSNEKAFILHSKGKRMKKYTYNKILQKLISRTQNETLQKKEIGIHNLRHSIATHLIEQGMQIEQVRYFLGHSQLETTEIYTHISQAQLNTLINE